MSRSPIPKASFLRRLSDLDAVEFVDGVAEVDVPVELLDELPLVGWDRPDTFRLESLVREIRNNGYNSAKRIVIQLDREGRWHIIDGGHRITAAKMVAKEFWTNLLGRKVRTLAFTLHQPPAR